MYCPSILVFQPSNMFHPLVNDKVHTFTLFSLFSRVFDFSKIIELCFAKFQVYFSQFQEKWNQVSQNSALEIPSSMLNLYILKI